MQDWQKNVDFLLPRVTAAITSALAAYLYIKGMEVPTPLSTAAGLAFGYILKDDRNKS